LVPVAAEGVNETGLVRPILRHCGDVMFAHRYQGDAHPLFPFVGALRVLVGVEQYPAAGGAPALLCSEEMPDWCAQWRGWLLAAAL